MNPVFRPSVSADIMSRRNLSIEIIAIIITLISILTIASSSYFVFREETLKRLAQEDGWVENLSAFNWFLAALLMLGLFVKQRNVWLLLLGILFVVCLGEELSWGQRLFGFTTPEWIRANNFQGEFNLHNINFFDRRYGDKGFWSVMRDIGRMFAIFWFTYGIVLPTLLKLSSRLRWFVRRIQLPVMPLTIGAFFLINYVVFQYFEDHHAKVCAYWGWVNNANCSSLPVEIREWYDSLLYLVFSVEVFVHRQKSVEVKFDKRDEFVFVKHQAEWESLDSQLNWPTANKKHEACLNLSNMTE